MIKAVLQPAPDILFAKHSLRIYDDNRHLIVAIRCDEIHKISRSSEKMALEAIYEDHSSAIVFCDEYEDETKQKEVQ